MSKLDNRKIMVCCANGAGSSLAMKMALEKVIDKFDAEPAMIHHCSISEARSFAAKCDIVLCSRNFSGLFNHAKAKGTLVIGLRNIMSPHEMEDALRSAGLIP